MPLTKEGKKVERTFEKEYGKEKGKSVFFGYIKKHPAQTSEFHRKRK